MLFCLITFLRFFSISLPLYSSNVTFTRSELAWIPELNQFQKGSTCGAHSIMVITYFANGVLMDPYIINNSISKRSISGGISPWSLNSYLIRQKIQSNLSFLSLLSNTRKIEWLKGNIVKGKPVIITTNNLTNMHFITVVGYQNNLFFLYDSQNSSDGNGLMAGNTTVTDEGLIDSWNKAKIGKHSINIAISEK